MAEPRLRYRLTKRQKLRRPSDFRLVYETGKKAGDDSLLVFARPNDLGVTRLGLSVSKKHGPAVTRNRIKRLLREAFRLDQFDLPAGLDVVLIPRVGSRAALSDYRRSLAGGVRRIVKRLPSLSSPADGREPTRSAETIAPERTT